jgi:hypothetical protein
MDQKLTQSRIEGNDTVLYHTCVSLELESGGLHCLADPPVLEVNGAVLIGNLL